MDVPQLVRNGGNSLEFVTTPWAKGQLDLFDRLQELPPNWKHYIHPDGRPYYIYTQGEDKTITNDNIRDRDSRDKLEESSRRLHWLRKQSFRNQEQYEDVELYLTFLPSSEQGLPSYYFVGNDWKQIFWCPGHDFGNLHALLGDTYSLELLLCVNFLHHLENFPSHRPVHSELLTFLSGFLVYATTEQTLYPNRAVSLMRPDECRMFLELLGRMKPDSERQNVTRHSETEKWFDDPGYTNWFVAVVLGQLMSSKRIQNYGTTFTPTYRYPHDIPQEKNNRHVTMWDKMIRCVLTGVSLGIFSTYFERIKDIWSDGMITWAERETLQKSLEDDLSDSNLLATVLLATNMSFLALTPTVTGSTLSIISTLFAAMSIAIGSHFIAHHRITRYDPRDRP
ncbi:hypothetical protein CPB86DRAFT_74664 [Serendipita vermifera]|nr:hypothetical protein CPB86DRAFT_74664 [Serendipita vermifera]